MPTLGFKYDGPSGNHHVGPHARKLEPMNAKFLWEHKGKHELAECERQLTEKWEQVGKELAKVAKRVAERDTCRGKLDHISLLMVRIEGYEDDKRKLLGIQHRAYNS